MSKRSGRAALIVFVAVEAAAGAFYLVVARNLWFFLDDWDFLVRRKAGDVGDLLRPHNEHWVTLPILAYRFLWWSFGLRTYRPYQALLVALHLAVGLLLWLVMRRAAVRPWTATLAASVFVLFGAGYQNIVEAFQICLVGSLAFGLVHLLLADHDGSVDHRDWLGMVAGLAALMCSGIGVTMVVIVGLMALMRRGWRVALLHTVPLAFIFLTWWITVGKSQAARRASSGKILHFVTQTLATTFRVVGQVTGIGVVIAVVLVTGLVVVLRQAASAQRWRYLAAPLALLVGAVVSLFITAVGRAGVAHLIVQSRYEDIVVALLVPALGVAADALMRRSAYLVLPVVVVLLIGIPGNLQALVNFTNEPGVKSELFYRRMIFTLPHIPIATQVPRSVVPEPTSLGQAAVNIGWLLDGAASGRIPAPSRLSAAEVAIDTVRLSVQQGPGLGIVGYTCRAIGRGVVVRLALGQRVTLLGSVVRVQLLPVDIPATGTYPYISKPAFSLTLVAVRPIVFRIAPRVSTEVRVCAPPGVLHQGR